MCVRASKYMFTFYIEKEKENIYKKWIANKTNPDVKCARAYVRA